MSQKKAKLLTGQFDYGIEPQQEDFCQQYVIDYNGEGAAIRAGYSEHTAAEQASRLLSKVKIRLRINDLIAERFNEIKLEARMVLKNLCAAANMDIGMAYDESGNLLPIKQMPEPLRKAITKIKTEELFSGTGKDREHIGTAKTIEITDRLEAAQMLGKHLKLFTDVLEVNAWEGLAEKLKAARTRLAKFRACQAQKLKNK